MKTILYNPIFINPQAYYVFPQLYDIEKGDQFIEPAVYSGYLLIEDLISNTSSQVTDTREVDFTQFAGKRIRISQYTNIGAVVLGEWLLPEGEQSGPSFHQSLVDAWFMSGLSNNDKPSSIRGVKGNEMVLKNFAYALNSGFGKYKVDFTKYTGSNTTSNSISIHKEAGINKGYATIAYSQLESDIPSYSIEIKGLNSGQILYYYRNNEGLEKNISYNKDGIYTLPLCYKEGTSGITAGFTINTVDVVTITQLPSAYEGALVFDGVDDYGICTGLPLMDDYTVICRRKIIRIKNSSAVASKRTYPGDIGSFGAFVFERVYAHGVKTTISFGKSNDMSEFDSNEVVYQTKTSYNGTTINSSNSNDSDILCLGANAYNISLGICQELSNVAIYYFALYNKSLTPEEIETEKERLNEEWLKRKTE